MAQFFKQSNEQTPLMRQALALMGNQQPINDVGGGILSATKSIAGALMQKKEQEKLDAKDAKNKAAIAAMISGGNAKPWVNPDTGKTEGTAGGIDGMVAALGGHSDTEAAQQMIPQLQMAKINQDQSRTIRDEDRIYKAILRKEDRNQELTDNETRFKQQVALRHQDRLTRLNDKRNELDYANGLAVNRDMNNKRLEVGLSPVEPGQPSGGVQEVSQPTGQPEMTIPEAKARNAALQASAVADVKAKAKLKAGLPQAEASVSKIISALDNMVLPQKDANGALMRGKDGRLVPGTKHPGLSDMVGAKGWGGLGAVIPGGDGEPFAGTDAANFKTQFDRLGGGAFLQAREALKGTGTITDFESKKAVDAEAAISLAQTEDEFVKAVMTYRDEVTALLELARSRAGDGNSDIVSTSQTIPGGGSTPNANNTGNAWLVGNPFPVD